VKNLLKNWTTTTSTARLQNPTAFVSKLFGGKSSQETSFSLNSMNPIENLTITQFLCQSETNPKQAVDGYLKM